MLTKKDWENALLIQDACNLSAVVHEWSAVLTKLWKEAELTGEGTDWVNTHPISVLYASKVASLAGCEAALSFSHAYDRCKNEIAFQEELEASFEPSVDAEDYDPPHFDQEVR